MKKTVTLTVVILLIVVISISSFIIIEYAFSNNWYNYTGNVKSQQLEREALTFTKNIVQLDYTKYYGQSGDLPNQFNPYTFQYHVNYQNSPKLSALQKNQQMLTLSYANVNHTEISFSIETDTGLILYRDDGNSVINQTKGILERYQTTYNTPYVQDFLNSLNSYSTMTNSSQQIGDFRLDMHSAYGIDTLTWSKTVNNISNSFDTLTLLFKDGIFNSFDDKWNSFTIGSSTVNISQEKAMQISDQKLETVQNVPFDGGFEGISDTKIIDTSVTYNLSFQPIGNITYGETGTLYPCWQLNGNVSYIGVTGDIAPFYALIRADTGQIQELRLGSYSLPI